jgi:DNA-binding NarL/FixJ family response regulator
VSIRVVVADDQAMVRRGFRLMLDDEPDMEVVAEAGDGEQAVRAIRALTPDVALMDIRMPGVNGLEATRRLAGQPTRIIVLTTFDLDEYVYEALRAGAAGFLTKEAPAEQLIEAVRVVAAGDGMLTPGVTRRVIEAFARTPAPRRSPALDSLTARELEVLRLMARGLSNPEIAAELFISDTTAKTHVSRILTKLGLRDRIQAVIFAYESGLVVPGSSSQPLVAQADRQTPGPPSVLSTYTAALSPAGRGRPGSGRFWAPWRGADVRGVDDCPGPVQLAGGLQFGQQQLVQLLPDPGPVPFLPGAASRSSLTRTRVPGAGTPTGCRCAARTGCRTTRAGPGFGCVPDAEDCAQAWVATVLCAAAAHRARSTAAAHRVSQPTIEDHRPQRTEDP